MTITVTTPNDTDIVVARAFAAPARLVFDYTTRPEHVRRWLLGPDGWGMPVCDIDLRIGGAYHYLWRNDADGAEFGARGRFKEIDAPHRVVHTEWMEGIGKASGEDNAALVTYTFVELGGRTTMTTTMRFPTKAIRDQALATGMTDGMAISYDRMEEMMLRKAA